MMILLLILLISLYQACVPPCSPDEACINNACMRKCAGTYGCNQYTMCIGQTCRPACAHNLTCVQFREGSGANGCKLSYCANPVCENGGCAETTFGRDCMAYYPAC